MLRTGKGALQLPDPHRDAPRAERLAADFLCARGPLYTISAERPAPASPSPSPPISSTESASNNGYEELEWPRGTTFNREGVENPRSGTWTVPGIVSILRRLDRWERAGVEPVAAWIPSLDLAPPHGFGSRAVSYARNSSSFRSLG